MNAVAIITLFILVFITNFETTHCDVRDNLIGPDYSGISLSNLSVVLSAGWCLYFGALLVALNASSPGRMEACKRFRSSIATGVLKPFLNARLYFTALLLAFGFRCAWYSEDGHRYTKLSFGTGASILPLILMVSGVTLLNAYVAAISRPERGQNGTSRRLTTDQSEASIEPQRGSP